MIRPGAALVGTVWRVCSRYELPGTLLRQIRIVNGVAKIVNVDNGVAYQTIRYFQLTHGGMILISCLYDPNIESPESYISQGGYYYRLQHRKARPAITDAHTLIARQLEATQNELLDWGGGRYTAYRVIDSVWTTVFDGGTTDSTLVLPNSVEIGAGAEPRNTGRTSGDSNT